MRERQRFHLEEIHKQKQPRTEMSSDVFWEQENNAEGTEKSRGLLRKKEVSTLPALR